MSLTERLRNGIKVWLLLEKSLRDLAERSGVPYAVLWRFANGKRDIRLAAADRLWGCIFGRDKRQLLRLALRDLVVDQMAKEGLSSSDFNRRLGTGMDEIDFLAEKLADPIIERVEKAATKEAFKIKKAKQK